MDFTLGGIPHCKRCKVEMTGTEKVCPSCDYHPKQRGLRLSLGCLFVVVLAMVGAQLSLLVRPMIGLYLVGFAGLSFAASFVLFFVAMAATPHRFGGLFLRF